ncbi:hypothetical protein MKX01_027040 [Papaver californicum]|nr:hypothetical protein MKX01_027040 [Papaver californicum]
MKNKVDDYLILPPNELRCVIQDGKKWRCRNRIADTGIKWCEKHYQKVIDNKIKASLEYNKKKRKKKLVQTETMMETKKNDGNEGCSSGYNGGGLEKSDTECKEKRKRKREIHSSSCVERRVSNRLTLKKMKRILDDDLTASETTTIQQTVNHDSSDGIEDGPPGFLKKRMKAEATETHFETHSKRCYEELRSSGESTNRREVELEKLLGQCESKCLELSIELEKKKKECIEIQGKLVDLERRKIAVEDEFKQLKRRQERTANSRAARLQQDQKVFCQIEERIHERITHLGGELKKITTELKYGKRRAEDEVEVWKKMFYDLETRVLRIEKVIQI